MTSEFDSNRNPAGSGQETNPAHSQDSVYLYKDSGIQEKHGRIPPWLLAVTVALIIWGIYYLVAFWSPPPG